MRLDNLEGEKWPKKVCRICTEFTKMVRRIFNFLAQNSDKPGQLQYTWYMVPVLCFFFTYVFHTDFRLLVAGLSEKLQIKFLNFWVV